MAPPLSPYLRNIPLPTPALKSSFPILDPTSTLTSRIASQGVVDGRMNLVHRIWSRSIQELQSVDLGSWSIGSSDKTVSPGLDSGLSMTILWSKRKKVPVEYVELVQKFSPGYIVLSYFVAVVGSLCTLELLLRRTSNRGTHNVILLVAAGICFGSVSTFSMHFIGNNSLVLHHPLEAERNWRALTLPYSAGWTVLSLVVSCTCMIGAFFVMGLEVGWTTWLARTFGRGETRRHTGGGVLGRKGCSDQDQRDEEEDLNNIQVTDLSDHALRERPGEVLSLDKDAVAKKSKLLLSSADQRKHALNLKLDQVVDKLEWALGWSMIDLGQGIGGRAERRRKKWEATQAEVKNQELEADRARAEGDNAEDDGDGDQAINEEPVVYHVRPPPSDPVASGYDNEIGPDDILPFQDRRGSIWDGGRVPRKLSGKEAEEGAIPSHGAGGVGRSARRGSVPNLGDIEVRPRDRTGSLFPPSAAPPMSAPLSSADAGSMFSPGFSFPGPGSTLNSASIISPSSTAVSTPSSRYPPPSILQGRRASVPVNPIYQRETPSAPVYTLARIQSYPEVDEEDPLTPASQGAQGRTQVGNDGSVLADSQRRTSTASVSFRINDYGETSTTALNRPGPLSGGEDSNQAPLLVDANGFPRKASRDRSIHSRTRANRRINKVRSWLGYDEVTAQEVRKILIGGTICGWGIAGMHYLGQKSIVGIPYISYSVGNVVASVVIACVAVIVALYIMFVILRPKLKHGWIVRIGVACILGAAVCIMHFVAMGGTTYALIVGVPPPSSAFGNTKKMITGIVATLAVIACLVIFSFTVIAHLRSVNLSKGRRKVVLAAMIYDEEDRLLVSPDGVLPMVDIASFDVDKKRRSLSRPGNWDADSTVSSILDIDLTSSHPAFIAALRSTWAWRQPGVLPARRPSLSRSPLDTEGTSGQEPSSTDTSSEPSRSRRISMLSLADSAAYPASLDSRAPMTLNVGKFMDRFSTAVGYLANIVTGNDQGVRRLGVLYDRILTTGHVSVREHRGHGSSTVSKGQLMFLVRRVTTNHEKSQLLARNFLFAEPYAVATVMSRTLAVPIDNFLDVIDDQRDFCDKGMSQDLRPGRLYATACIIQPTTFEGIRVCVDPSKRCQLPQQEICTLSSVASSIRTQDTSISDMQVTGTIEEIGEALLGLNGQTLFEMLAPRNQLLLSSDTPPEDPSVTRLRRSLVDNLIPMLDGILSAKAMTQILPRLTLVPTLIPLTAPIMPSVGKPHGSRVHEIATATSIAWSIMFKAILPVDTDHSGVDWESWALFRAQQECVLRDGRQGQLAARNAISHAALTSPIHNPARRPSKIQWSTSFLVDDSSSLPRESSIEADSNSQATSQHGGTEDRPPIYDSAAQGRWHRNAPNLTIAVPRRSSLAPSMMDGPSSYDAVDQSEAAPGVSLWHPDWLARVLRQDLSQRPAEHDGEKY